MASPEPSECNCYNVTTINRWLL
ncbi:hypothetical protein [Sessilibacter corallicola]